MILRMGYSERTFDMVRKSNGKPAWDRFRPIVSR